MNSKNAIYLLNTPKLKKWILLLILAGVSFRLYSQESDTLLQKPITISIKGLSVYQALNRIGETAGCFFIYDSKDVKSDKKAQAIDVIETPLKEVLNKLIPNPNIAYKVIDKHILLYQQVNTVDKSEKQEIDSTEFIVVGGRIFDKDTKNAIPFATIAIEKLGLGTISNYDGFFNLRIPKYYTKLNIVISYLGYQNLTVPIEILQGKTYNLYIKPRYIPIQEVFIRNIDAKGIVKAAIENKSLNYSDKDVFITSFYREGVKRNNNYLNYSEAVFKIFKSDYSLGSEYDQVRLLKSRKLELSDRRDTLIVKLKAGIKGALDLDIVKSIPDFLDPEYMDNYIYTKTDIVAHDSRSAYAITFEQKPSVTQPRYSGTLYIDVEKLVLLDAEFGVNPKYVEKAGNLFVLKKDRKIDIKPESITYSVKYRELNGKYYIHHIRGDLSFKVRERRQIFANTYSLFLEYVGIQIDTLNVERFSRREILRPYTIFSEGKYTYDALFWGELNIITPEDDINKALSKINPKIESINNDTPAQQ